MCPNPLALLPVTSSMIRTLMEIRYFLLTLKYISVKKKKIALDFFLFHFCLGFIVNLLLIRALVVRLAMKLLKIK